VKAPSETILSSAETGEFADEMIDVPAGNLGFNLPMESVYFFAHFYGYTHALR
jgi:hypothetical protein